MKSPKKMKPVVKPEPMVFEHVPVESTYDRIAGRVLAAISELNKALEEANECAGMRVFLGTFKAEGHAMRFEPQIYRLSHSTLTYSIKVSAENGPAMQWQKVKDPAFKDAAGQGFDALRKKVA